MRSLHTCRDQASRKDRQSRKNYKDLSVPEPFTLFISLRHSTLLWLDSIGSLSHSHGQLKHHPCLDESDLQLGHRLPQSNHCEPLMFPLLQRMPYEFLELIGSKDHHDQTSDDRKYCQYVKRKYGQRAPPSLFPQYPSYINQQQYCEHHIQSQ